MSLIHAFLREPTPGFNVWVADLGPSGPKGSGTLRDPYNGSTAAKFDAVMRRLAERGEPVHINLGTGVFETAGFNDAAPNEGWQAAPAMKIFGAGIGATTLKLVGMSNAASQYFAVGHALASGSGQGVRADYFEIGDLTIDCGITGATSSGIAAGAIRVKGTHTRVRRVRAINWGTKSSSLPCYVIAGITADPLASERPIFDVVIDECTIVSPGPNITGPVALLHIGGASEDTVFLEHIGESAVISNCFVDGTPDWGETPVDPLGLDIRAISVNSCHGTIVEGNRISNVRVGGPCQFVRSVPQIIVRNNLYANVVFGPLITVGWLLPVTPTTVSVVLRAPNYDQGVEDWPPPASKRWSVTAPSAEHGFVEGDPVRLSDASGSTVRYGRVFMVPDTTGSNTPALNTFRLYSAETGLTAMTKIQKIAAIGNLLIEGNTFELSRHAVVSGDVPVAIRLAHNSEIAALPNKAGQVVIRNNRFRLVDANPDSAVLRAMNIADLTASLVVDNMYDTEVSNADLASIEDCKELGWYNNRNFEGDLIEAPQGSDVIRQDETDAALEEAFTQACFKH